MALSFGGKQREHQVKAMDQSGMFRVCEVCCKPIHKLFHCVRHDFACFKCLDSNVLQSHTLLLKRD